MSMEKDDVMLLGKIDGKLDGIAAHLTRQDKRVDDLDSRMNGRLNDIDSRLREVEKKAAVAGAVSGGAVAVGTAILVETIKQFIRGGGPGIGP
ncbi:hypothetical protein [Ottowia oryzae]